MKFKTKYTKKERKGFVFKSPSLTEQCFKQECDINSIVARYKETGQFYDPMNRLNQQPRMYQFMDCSEVPDYGDALNVVRKANDMFLSLDSKVRDRFGNNPKLLFDFLSKEENREEAQKLGLLKPVETPVAQNVEVHPAQVVS